MVYLPPPSCLWQNEISKVTLIPQLSNPHKASYKFYKVLTPRLYPPLPSPMLLEYYYEEETQTSWSYVLRVPQMSSMAKWPCGWWSGCLPCRYVCAHKCMCGVCAGVRCNRNGDVRSLELAFQISIGSKGTWETPRVSAAITVRVRGPARTLLPEANWSAWRKPVTFLTGSRSEVATFPI